MFVNVCVCVYLCVRVRVNYCFKKYNILFLDASFNKYQFQY